MTNDRDARWQELDALLDRLFDAAPEAREAILREVDAENLDLARDARRLLAVGEKVDLRPGGALATGLLRGIEPSPPEADAALGKRIGSWRLVDDLGRGGMGRVYLAERADGQFEQRVALKLLPTGAHSDDMLRRFEQERRILARLDHPQIARLLDGGTTPEGRPWFAMELVEGSRSIDAYCDLHRMSVDERLRLFVIVAEAVHAAHRSLVLHRDLKPANILVTPAGEVKLLDFGIAKLLDAADRTADATRTLHRMLTPSYATPEQIRGESLTTASDVYQLGLLLYELLTGRRAHRLDETTPQAIEHAVCDTPPTRPSLAVLERSPPRDDGEVPVALAAARDTTPARLARRLRGDLDTILLTALRKEPERRYASAEQLAADVQRHLEGLPVEARLDSILYRAEKFVRRHVVGVIAAAGVVLLTATLIGFYTERLARERTAAEQSAARARREATRAAAALADTERALARAETLREFLVDLFRAAGSTRPRDQLPTTEEILTLGAQRALDERSALPAERLGMLLTVGRVYLQRYQLREARPLIGAAVTLARQHRSTRPEDLALALTERAALAWHGGGTLAAAEATLLEAESIVAGKNAMWNTFANARADRAWVASLRDDDEQAVSLLRPLYEEMQARDDVRLSVRFAIVHRLAGTLHRVGNLQSAAELHAEANDLARRAFGAESSSYAIQLANSANVERELGRYAESDARNLQAIALYDRIYGESPNVYRSVARRNRVRTLLAMGRFDEALSELAASTHEYSLARGVADEEDANRFFHQGEMLLQMHRWGEAEARLNRAHELYGAAPERDVPSLAKTEAMLAWARCRQGELGAARRVLAALDEHAASELPSDNRSRAQRHAARACVAFLSGDHERALRTVDLALAAVTSPGRVVDRADRMILRARILAATGRSREAASELGKAESLYLDLDLTDHPLFAEIAAARRDLTAGTR